MIPLPRPLAAARILVLAGVLLGSAGCARIFSSFDVAPNGMPRRDDNLRRLLASGQADSALARVAEKGESAPEDELLRALYSGILAHYAGAYDSSAVALDRAAELAEDRYTKRVSRAALSLVTNDKVLPYDPGETERLLIHYYGALNFLRRGSVEGAAVEARRLSALLERVEVVRDSSLHGWLRYFSGAVFEAAGEWNDADVAYRNARALLGPGLEVPERSWSMGEVVVLVEEGFVAHRVEQAVTIPLYSFELSRLSRGDTGERLGAAAMVTARVLAEALAETQRRGHYGYYTTRPRTLRVSPLPREVVLRECEEEEKKRPDDEKRGDRGRGNTPTPVKGAVPVPIAGPTSITGSAGGVRDGVIGRTGGARGSRTSEPRRCTDTRNPYLLRIAWPVFRQEPGEAGVVRVVSEAAETAEVAELRTNLTTAVLGDFDEERAGILTRTILRGVAKAMVTRGIERAPGEDAAGWGKLLGATFNLGTALLEQADTRSWQLLPDRIKMVRLRLPPGEHEIALELSGAAGERRRVELGSVSVKAGRVSFLSGRIWH